MHKYLARYNSGFTIVELLVVIVVIGVLAAITIVSYTGISRRAVIAVVKSDLANVSKKLELYQVENSSYPVAIDSCPAPTAGSICFNLSGGNSLVEYQADNTTYPPRYNIVISNGDALVGDSSTSEAVAVSSYRKDITINHAKVGSGGVANFPVLVNLSGMGNDFFDNVKPDGSDIRVFKVDGITRLPIEVVFIDKLNRTGELWFRADILSDTEDTKFYIQYGNITSNMAAKNYAYGSQSVWASYDLMAHMQNGVFDSTVQNRNFIVKSANTTQVVDRLGNVDGAYALDSVDFGNKIMASDSGNVGEFGDKTYSVWVKPSTLANNAFIYDHYNWHISVSNTPGGTRFAVGRMTDGSGPQYGVASTMNILTSNWYRLKGVYHPDPGGGNGYIKYYINGVLQGTEPISNREIWVDYSNFDVQWGNSNHGAAVPFNGNVDESDVYDGIQSDAFILTDYNNQSDPSTFYSIGAQEIWSEI
jgi:general secretion pathway protein G